ncbi:MAG: mechanosensitive ion channel domain-containing protein, partial [Candidatus Omnitrophota bacterium]
MMREIMETVIFQNRIFDYLVCLFIFFIAVFVIKLFNRIVLARLKRWAERTATILDDFLIAIFRKNFIPLLYFGAFYLSIRSLTLTPLLSKIINVLGLILLTIFTIRFLIAVINYILRFFWLKKETDAAREQSLLGVIIIIKVVVWGLGLVFLLDNLGFKISTVIAGLGIGGVAVALAAQAVLGDLFSYFAIFFDRPFELGDFIIVGDLLGTVEHIGIKTTRIRSLGGEQIVFSNTDLTNSRVRNYKRMDKRRVVFSLGITYQTNLAQLKQIPGIVRGIIENIKDTVFDRAHFFSYGDFNLVVEVVYYVLSRDYNKYMDIQQEINFTLKEKLGKEGIRFAHPVQRVFLAK